MFEISSKVSITSIFIESNNFSNKWFMSAYANTHTYSETNAKNIDALYF